MVLLTVNESDMSRNDPTDHNSQSDPMMTESTVADAEDVLISYLYHLLYAVQLLLRTDDDEDDDEWNTEEEEEENDRRAYPHEERLAEWRRNHDSPAPLQLFATLRRTLLQCCAVEHLARPLTRRQLRECRALLLAPEKTEKKYDPTCRPGEEAFLSSMFSERSLFSERSSRRYPVAAETAYRFRRLDAVRRVLRSAAPVALDVVAAIVHDENPEEHADTTTAAYVLLCLWLPVAPHLRPLVTQWWQRAKNIHPIARMKEWQSTFSHHVVLLLEVTWILCQCYRQHRDSHTLREAVDWSPLFLFLKEDSAAEEEEEALNPSSDVATTMDVEALDPGYISRAEWTPEWEGRWYAMRILAWVQSYAPVLTAALLKTHRVYYDDPYVPWRQHPWAVEEEELVFQKHHIMGRTPWLGKTTIRLPDLLTVRSAIPLHPSLWQAGPGLCHVRHRPAAGPSSLLMTTATTARNLHHLGLALCGGEPILLCGPAGAGKSTLVRALAKEYGAALLELHVDAETDGPTLVGAVRATDLPGEFAWRPGPLAQAVATGQWVLLEDLDNVSRTELQSVLEPLWKQRLLPLGNGETLRCHANFRCFATLRTDELEADRAPQPVAEWVGRRRILNPALWTMVYVNPLTVPELKEIAMSRHPTLPPSIIDATLAVFQALEDAGTRPAKFGTGRHVSVRDVWKVLSRIANTVSTWELPHSSSSYTTEQQRTLCVMEVMDVFAAAAPAAATRRAFLTQIVAPTFQLAPETLAMERRNPVRVEQAASWVLGRVLWAGRPRPDGPSFSFAPTASGWRLMEAMAVCIREKEPVLLVGETGTGKTTVLQYLAHCCGRALMVQNLSLQTDATDLLGGYRPLRIQQVAQNVYQTFVDLFTGTFSRKQNLEFLNFAATALQKEQWMKLSQCFRRAAQLGLSKLQQQEAPSATAVETWEQFHATAERFEKQRVACASGLAFVFTEGALVDAIRQGTWVLLDEINLASSETLQRLCGLLDDSSSSLTLTERGDAVAIERHPSFRLFAAMNPATDAGKKDLALSIRTRFTELYVDELLDPLELRIIASRYLSDVVPCNDGCPENSETIIVLVDLYLQCRDLADRALVDGNGQKPRYTLRTLSRALTAARTIVVHQKHSLYRALYEGFQLAFQGPLDEKSLKIVDDALLRVLGNQFDKSQLDHPGKRPGGKVDGDGYVLVKPFWIKSGPRAPVDWSVEDEKTGRSRFILVPSTQSNLRRLARAIASGPWPILLEGPTSAGKTSLVEYIAARCGHYVVRINNHEHTDVQEYTGGFAADPNGLLTFVDGILVRALRLGHWVILDELNLAPSEVLEALNRLLDDNRELYIPELNETVKPHANFRLFATQNPSGSYGGRKPLSRAFRNRFVEIQVNDIPSAEMTTILEKRCGCPPSYARILVDVMDSLRHRRSRSGVFLGKDGLITPRDLLRWADRGASSKLELAQEGYMLLAERLRSPEERDCVKEVIEKYFKVSLGLDSVYYGNESFARSFLARLREVVVSDDCTRNLVSTIAETRSLLRLITLVHQCVKHHEPVLLVGGMFSFLVCCFNSVLPSHEFRFV
jgi:midasin (ATPase involved in ribosome maturation)